MDRQDPILDTTPIVLNERVKLPWREVKALSETEKRVPLTQPEPIWAPEPEVQTPPPVVPAPKVEAVPLRALDENDRRELVEALMPAIVAQIQTQLNETIEASLSNALARTRADMERTLPLVTAKAIQEAIDKTDLTKFLKSSD